MWLLTADLPPAHYTRGNHGLSLGVQRLPRNTAHGGPNPTAPENRYGRPGSDGTGPHSRVSVQVQKPHAQQPPHVGLLCCSLHVSLHPLSASWHLPFFPSVPPSCRLPSSPETPEQALDGLPAAPAQHPPCLALCVGTVWGTHGPSSAPVRLWRSLGLSFLLTTVLPAPCPVRPSDWLSSLSPHRLFLPLRCSPAQSAFPCRLPFLSQSFTLSLPFLYSAHPSSLHLDTPGSPKGTRRAGPGLASHLPCPLWATAVPHSHTLAFGGGPGSDSEPSSCFSHPQALTGSLVPTCLLDTCVGRPLAANLY